MTGPEHYEEAEGILARAKTDALEDRPLLALAVSLAQVHATLALAAATALGGDMFADRRAWYEMAGVKPT